MMTNECKEALFVRQKYLDDRANNLLGGTNSLYDQVMTATM